MEFTEINILYSKPLRRLGDKTQMIDYKHQVHFRNRLTHSLEVYAVADEIAKRINESNDIVDRVLLREMCLVHDFGHTPFGHIGEQKINELLNPLGFAFKHNVFSFKLLIENFDKVRWEVLDGVLKHTSAFYNTKKCSLNHNIDMYQIKDCIEKMISDNKILKNFFENSNNKYLNYMEHPDALSIEGQILHISDEIAQRASDLDDAFRIIRIKALEDNEKNPEKEEIRIDISNDDFYKKFRSFCCKKHKNNKIMNLLKDLLVLCNEDNKININFKFVTEIRDFFIDELIKGLELKKLSKYSFKRIIRFTNKEIKSFSESLEKLFYGTGNNDGFHNRAEIYSANQQGSENIEKLYEYYDLMSKCKYASDKLRLAKAKTIFCKAKRISAIKDKEIQSKCKLITLEEIAKMTNQYVIGEIEVHSKNNIKERILQTLEKHGNAKISELSAYTKVGETTIKKLLTMLQQEKIIQREGNAKNGYWKIIR